MNLVNYFFVAFCVCLKLADCYKYLPKEPTPPNGILEPKDLNKLLKDPQFDKGYRLLEVNSSKNKTGFDKGHIKNAIFFDTMECVKVTKLIPSNIPDKACFEKYVESLGISDNHQIILYDRSQYGFFIAPRAWWIFRLYGHKAVLILSGGFNTWVENKYTLTTDAPKYRKGRFKIKENNSLIRNYTQIKKNLKIKEELVIDARTARDFKKGNIPNSVNVPYSELFNSRTKTIKNPKELTKVFKSHGVDPSKPLIASGRKSVTASALAFAGYLINIEKLPVYLGSWLEYCQIEKICK